jgi:RNA polymerase sigma-70 factor (ECF subfamily)
VARREAADILDEFLGSLDADKCAVFVLSELEGRRGPEIAQTLQVNLNTVYARLRAARQRFDDAMADHRAPARRPLFAAWLGWAWPTWLGKPAAVGVAAIAAALVVGAAPSVPSASAGGEPEVTAAVPTVAVADVPEGPWSVRSHGHRLASEVEAAPELVVDDDELVVFDDEPVPTRPRARVVPSAASTDPAPAVAAAEVEAEPSFVLGPPTQAPWSSTIEARQPVRHPSLLALRQDFIAELLRVATGL